MVIEKIQLKSPDEISEDTILVELYIKTEKLPLIILVPGAAGSKQGDYITVYIDIIERFLDSAFNVVAFSPRGQVGSTGDFSFKKASEDIKTVINYITENKIATKSIGLFGKSAGSIVSMLCLKNEVNITSFAGWGTPTNLYERHYKKGKKREEMFSNLRAKGTRIKNDIFLNDLINAEKAISNVYIPLMLGWGNKDLKYSTYEEQLNLISKANNRHVIQLNIVTDCGHSVCKKDKMFDNYSSLFVNWFKLTL